MMLKFLDILFTVMHLMIIGFNIIGWIWRRTRKVHLMAVILTAMSWFLLGIWYGWGYCFLTDWHWQIKRRSGETDLPNSFIKYFADRITGSVTDATLIDTMTAGTFAAIIIITIYINILMPRIRKDNPGHGAERN